MQVVRTRPHVSENQSPEVNDRQAIRVHRATCLLRDEVIHHAQEASGQEEAHSIVAIPPLHHRVLCAAVGRVGLHPTCRHSSAVDDVQQSNGNDEGTVEPVSHINMLNFSRADSAKEHHRVRHPNHGDQQVDRPFKFSIFLTLGKTQRQAHSRGQDDQLPTPEGESGQLRHE